MKKVICYLYRNRVELIQSSPTFTVEYKKVYQNNIKLHAGIDNVVEFDFKNADQKRIDINTLTLYMTVMDAQGNELDRSPYTLTITPSRGIAYVTVPAADLDELEPQYLRYSVYGVDQNGQDILFYCDSNFNAIGTIEVIDSVFGKVKRESKTYDTFSGDINLYGEVVYHSSSIPTKSYEAEPITEMDFEIYMTEFVGEVWLEGTADSTISVESYKNASRISHYITTVPTTTVISFSNIPVTDYEYFRISWSNGQYRDSAGTVDKIIVQ